MSEQGFFTEVTSAEVVISRNAKTSNARLAEVMAILTRNLHAAVKVGSNNLPTRVYENPPDLVDWLASEMLTHDITPEIEYFDLSHIHQAAAMQRDGRLKAPAYVQFVMGVKNAMPADHDVVNYYIQTVERLLPFSEWCPAGIGPAHLTLSEWSVAAGGHSSHSARAMPLLWRADAHRRELPSRAKAAITGASWRAGSMMERPSFPSTRHRSLLRRRVADACRGRRKHLEMDRFRCDQTACATAFSAICFPRASQSRLRHAPICTAATTVGALSP